MPSRREMLKRSAGVASLLAGLGLLPQAAQAAYASAAFDAMTMAELVKALGVATPTDSKLVGPSFKDITTKHGARADAQAYLAGKIKLGGGGVWGPMPMPPQTLSEEDATVIAHWLTHGARK